LAASAAVIFHAANGSNDIASNIRHLQRGGKPLEKKFRAARAVLSRRLGGRPAPSPQRVFALNNIPIRIRHGLAVHAKGHSAPGNDNERAGVTFKMLFPAL
jgi:hypothetical protein